MKFMEMDLAQFNEVFNTPEKSFGIAEENALIRKAQGGNEEARNAIIANRMNNIVCLAVVTISTLGIIPPNQRLDLDVLNTLVSAAVVGANLSIDDYIVDGGAHFKSHCRSYVVRALKERASEFPLG